jgi:hypothetical protein
MMRRLLIRFALVALLFVALEPVMRLSAAPSERKDFASRFACTENGIGSYVARRAAGPIQIDGLLDEPSWQKAEKSPRFVDMVTGEPGWYDTRVAVMWDDENLYVGYWIEQPYVEAHLTERNSLIWLEGDAEVFIDGGDAYYEFEVNPLGTLYEVFFIWRDAYQPGGVFDVPEFDILKRQPLTFGGDYDRQAKTFWRGTHPRGLRWAFLGWEFPGMRAATHVEGKINDNATPDKGWTVEVAFPWKGMKYLAAGRSLPPKDGDTWRLFFGRFELFRVNGAEVEPHPAWVLSPHRVYDTHLPECFPYVRISAKTVGEM